MRWGKAMVSVCLHSSYYQNKPSCCIAQLKQKAFNIRCNDSFPRLQDGQADASSDKNSWLVGDSSSRGIDLLSAANWVADDSTTACISPFSPFLGYRSPSQ